MTAPTLWLFGRAGIWDETPQCQFDDLADAVLNARKARHRLGDEGKAVGVASRRLCYLCNRDTAYLTWIKTPIAILLLDCEPRL